MAAKASAPRLACPQPIAMFSSNCARIASSRKSTAIVKERSRRTVSAACISVVEMGGSSLLSPHQSFLVCVRRKCHDFRRSVHELLGSGSCPTSGTTAFRLAISLAASVTFSATPGSGIAGEHRMQVTGGAPRVCCASRAQATPTETQQPAQPSRILSSFLPSPPEKSSTWNGFRCGGSEFKKG